jgi:hypothetical protein
MYLHSTGTSLDTIGFDSFTFTSSLDDDSHRDVVADVDLRIF